MGSHRVGHDGSDLAAAAYHFKAPSADAVTVGSRASTCEFYRTHSSVHNVSFHSTQELFYLLGNIWLTKKECPMVSQKTVLLSLLSINFCFCFVF